MVPVFSINEGNKASSALSCSQRCPLALCLSVRVWSGSARAGKWVRLLHLFTTIWVLSKRKCGCCQKDSGSLVVSGHKKREPSKLVLKRAESLCLPSGYCRGSLSCRHADSIQFSFPKRLPSWKKFCNHTEKLKAHSGCLLPLRIPLFCGFVWLHVWLLNLIVIQPCRNVGPSLLHKLQSVISQVH